MTFLGPPSDVKINLLFFHRVRVLLTAFLGKCRYSSPLLFNNDEVHGGSPHGAGTIAGSDGSRMPSNLEKEVSLIYRLVVLRRSLGKRLVNLLSVA